MKFVRVPAGTFVMGENPPLSEGKRDERPAHEVTISRPFYIGMHEVTQAHVYPAPRCQEKTIKTSPSAVMYSASKYMCHDEIRAFVSYQWVGVLRLEPSQSFRKPAQPFSHLPLVHLEMGRKFQ